MKADEKNSEGPKTIKKRVEIITNCSCISCERVQNKDCELNDENTSELPTDLFVLLHPNSTSGESSQQASEEVPELMHIGNRNRSGMEALIHREKTPDKLIALLRSFVAQDSDEEEGSNIKYDKALIKELLEIIERHKQELEKVDLMGLVNIVGLHNSENSQLDLSKLKEVLHAFQRRKELTEKHRSYGIDLNALGTKNNEQIEKDSSDLIKKYDLSKNFGVVYHNRHRIQENLVDDEHNNHHYLGEEQHVGLDDGHLVPGPHGSLVLAPERLQLDPEMVTPNREGVVISYENHPRNLVISSDEE